MSLTRIDRRVGLVIQYAIFIFAVVVSRDILLFEIHSRDLKDSPRLTLAQHVVGNASKLS